MLPSIYDIGLAESTLFELYKSKGYDNTLIALKIAEDKISKAILTTNGEWTKTKLNEIKKQINEEIGTAYGSLYPDMVQESVDVATVTSNAMLGTISSKLPLRVVNDLTNSNRQLLGYGFKELFKITEDNHARQLRVLFASGVAQGLTAEQIVRNIGVKNASLSKGQLRTNVFTTIADSRNIGNYTAFDALDKAGVVKYYEHVSTLDGSTSIDICVPRDGRKYFKPIAEIPVGDKPPLHFNCRSKLLPRTGGNVSPTRPSQDGEIPTEKYPSWFKKQSADFQRKVLGKTKYNAFKSGVFKVESLPDVLGNVAMSLDEVAETLNDFVKNDDTKR